MFILKFTRDWYRDVEVPKLSLQLVLINAGYERDSPLNTGQEKMCQQTAEILAEVVLNVGTTDERGTDARS